MFKQLQKTSTGQRHKHEPRIIFEFLQITFVFLTRALRKNKMGGCVEQNMGMTVQKRRVTGLKQFRLTELRARIPNMPSLCSRKALHCFISVW